MVESKILFIIILDNYLENKYVQKLFDIIIGNLFRKKGSSINIFFKEHKENY